MDEKPPTWLDRTEEIALPLYGFALGSVVAGVDPLVVLATILWWDARYAADAPTAVAAVAWTALMIPIAPVAVAVAAVRTARSIRRPWYGWGGSLVALGIAAARWNGAGQQMDRFLLLAAAAALAAGLATPAIHLFRGWTRRLATTSLRPVVVGTRRTPLHLPPDDDFDSFP